MDETNSQNISQQYQQMVANIQDDFIKNLYSKFDYSFFRYPSLDENSYSTISSYNTFIYEKLCKSKFIVYHFLPNENVFSFQNYNLRQKRTDNITELVFATFCTEGECIIIENISIYILITLIDDLKSLNISLLNVSPNSKNKNTEEEEENFRLELINFYKSLNQNEISQNFFVNITIYPISCYLIRRYFYPTSFFKNQSFFNYNQAKPKKEHEYKMKLACFFNDLKYMSTVEAKNSHENIIKEIALDLVNIRIPEDFFESDFIILRQVYSTKRAKFYFVIHRKTLYIFLMKKMNKPDNSKKRFRREIKFCEKSSNRCLTQFYGFLKDGKQVIGFIYEYMCNGSLDEYIKSNKNNSIFFKMTAINRIFEGIEYIHSISFVHRDLKPLNILIDHDNLPFIADFDMVRELDEDECQSSIKNHSFDVGSLLYSSPEQDSSVNVSFPTDIYSFGLIVYFIIEGKNLLSTYYEKENIIRKLHSQTIYSENLSYLIENCIKQADKRIDKTKIRSIINEECQKLESTSLIEKTNPEFIFFYYENILTIHSKIIIDNIYFIGNLYLKGNIFKKDYNEAKKYLEVAASYNNSNALNDLGFMYQFGLSVKKDFIKAIFYYESAAKQKNSTAMVNLGVIYRNGQLIEKDLLKARYYFELAAEQNNSDAINNLGDMYYHGFGVKVDFKKAIYYYESAAKLNNSYAQNNLGTLYFNGIAVSQDLNKARYYFELAAEQNNSNSLFNLGLIYQNGIGVKVNHLKAINYYKSSAEQNNSAALLNLGNYFFKGICVNLNYRKAKECFEYSAGLNNPGAFNNLGKIYLDGLGVDKDYVKAKHYFELSAQLNDLNAYNMLALIYFYGYGVEKNYNKAISLINYSAINKNVDAIKILGFIYENGYIFLNQNYLKAKQLYKIGASQGDEDCIFLLGRLYYDGHGVNRDYYKAMKYFKLAAEKNSPNGLLYLGKMYYNGYGVLEDKEKAELYYELASESEYSSVFIELGEMYEDGIDAKKDYKKALKLYKSLSNIKNEIAQCKLGDFYYDDDKHRALYYYKLSADNGSAEALWKIGRFYYHGYVVEQNYSMVKKYFEKSSEFYDPESFIKLGKLYEEGKGVEQNYLKAKYYYEISAQFNHSKAYLKIGKFYENGKGMNQNYSKAREFYELSAQLNNSVAQFCLGYFYSSGEHFIINNTKAIDYYTKCAQNDYFYYKYFDPNDFDVQNVKQKNKYKYLAINNLGLIYLLDNKDIENAYGLFENAGFIEYPFLLNNYGLLIHYYPPKKSNDEETYFIKASKKKFSLSDFNLAILYENTKDKEKSIQCYINASNNEDEPLIYNDIHIVDKQLEISKTFIVCLTNLILTEYYLSRKNFNLAKNYFIKSLKKIYINTENSIYKFNFIYDNNESDEPFSYLKYFILQFPLFNLKNQPNLPKKIETLLNMESHINNQTAKDHKKSFDNQPNNFKEHSKLDGNKEILNSIFNDDKKSKIFKNLKIDKIREILNTIFDDDDDKKSKILKNIKINEVREILNSIFNDDNKELIKILEIR